jgi:hypothetical protein
MSSDNLLQLHQLFGKLELNVTHNKIYARTPSFEMVDSSGNTVQTQEFTEIIEPEVLYADTSILVTKANLEYGGETVSILVFDASQKEYWLYLGYGPFGFHLREYFTKSPTDL